jgi:predicted small metal-binding protein
MPENKPKNNPGMNPDVNTQGRGINPSAPTVGTEGWGQTSDERRVLGDHRLEDTRAGQMKGNPGDEMTAASQREEQRATSNKKPSADSGEDQPELSRLTSGSAHSMTHNQPHANRTFRCADAGHADCNWQTSGDTDDEIVRRAEEHWRREHGMGDWTEAARSKAREAIKHRQAA